MNADASGQDGGGAFPTTLSAGWAAGYYITRALTPAPGLPTPPRCVNDDAVWLLSSAKPGNGIPQLLSDNVRPLLCTHAEFPSLAAACAPTHPPLSRLTLPNRPRHPRAVAKRARRSWTSTGSPTARSRT